MGKSRSTFQPTPEASASLVLARTKRRDHSRRRPALLIARYSRCGVEEQSGDRPSGVLRLVRSGRERRRRTLSRSSTRNESRPQLSFGDGTLLPSIDIRGRRAGDFLASSSEVDVLAHGHGVIIRESKIPGRVGGVVGHCQE
jgi:hypothetical protein